MQEITIPHKFNPREYQFKALEAIDSGFNRFIWVVEVAG